MLSHVVKESENGNYAEEICLAMVKENGRKLAHIPIKKRNFVICLAAVKQNAKALEHVPFSESVLSDQECICLCLESLKRDGSVLIDIPRNSFDIAIYEIMYSIALKQNGLVLQDIPQAHRTHTLCLDAVNQCGYALEHVPVPYNTASVDDKSSYRDICLAAVRNIGRSLRYIPLVLRDKTVCLAAVEKDGYAFQFVPPVIQMILYKENFEVCLSSVKKNGEVLGCLSEDIRAFDLCMASVRQNGLVLSSVPEDKLNRDEISKIYFEAVRQNAEAVKYVPENLREEIIDRLGVKSIIANNYLAIKHFPEEHKYSEEIKHALASVKHVAINQSPKDHEMHDIQLFYTKTNENVVSIQCTVMPKEVLNNLIHELKRNGNSNDLHLALIGHAAEEATSIAGLNIEDIVSVCEENPCIRHIQLLGCNVAKSKPSMTEIVMIDRFNQKMEIKDKLQYGLASTVAVPNKPQEDKDFQRKCLDFCKKYNFDGMYVLNKASDVNYQLISIKIDKITNIMVIKTKNIPHRKVEFMAKVLQNQKKGISFPDKPGQFLPIRQQPMTLKELASLRALAYEVDRFDKTHPKHDKYQKTYPFLANITAGIEDLMPSLMQKLAVKLSHSEIITWQLILEGPTHALHINTMTEDFEVTRTYLYMDNYKVSMFGSSTENIYMKKLRKEQEEKIDEMRLGSQGRVQSMAKLLTVVVPERKM